MTQTLIGPKWKRVPAPWRERPAPTEARSPRRRPAKMNEAPPEEFRWSAEAYNAAADAGCFDGKRVQLLRGRVWFMPGMGDPHKVGIMLGSNTLHRLFPTGHSILCQLPLRLGDSEPEPDLCVVRGDPRLINDRREDVVLVIEVADSSLALDRGEKASIYAENGYRDYWISNIPNRQVEVRRDPFRAADGTWGYASVTIHADPDEEVALLERPDLKINVADLLPLRFLGLHASPSTSADAAESQVESNGEAD